MNWKQELQAEILAIDDINANTAELAINIEDFGNPDDWYEGGGAVTTIIREIRIKAPQAVSISLIDGKNYLAGDFYCEISFVELQKALKPQSGDPYIRINGVTKGLTQQRPFKPSANWGLKPGTDSISIDGDKWTIVRITGNGWLDSEPSYFTLVLRK